ncbi:MAG: hypothetical protein JEY91_16855, partial [Spirochaetaceae bacterium]|nr:hypothetical protein [Spirochaetaceae bacterium]
MNSMKATKLVSVLLISLFLSLLLGCPSDLGSSNTIVWNGNWENSSHYYGTFTLDMTFDGENMDRHGGEGTILGHITWTGYDGAAIVDRAVSGNWE